MNNMVSKYIHRILFTRWAAFIHDLICIPVVIFLTLWLRFNLGDIPLPYWQAGEKFFLLALPIQGTLFWGFGFYRSFWRFASFPDIVRIVKAAIWGIVLIALVSVVFLKITHIPRSIFVLYPILLILCLGAPRLIYRYLKDHHANFLKKEGKRVLIFGAGRAGEALIRDILSSEDFHPVGFIDADPKKHGREIHGMRVLGGIGEIGEIVTRLNIAELFLAIPRASRELIQSTVNVCSDLGIACKILPSIEELLGEKIETDHLRPITVEDLLGREPIHLEKIAIFDFLKGKRVLVSGGGGSIGSELCRQIAEASPGKLIVFENSEFNLYSIGQELRAKYPNIDSIEVLGDVKVKSRVDWAFRSFRPDVVFHAAAYKHVPMLEKNPVEGILNNVIGTQIIADASNQYGVQRFVLVSTDKAVNPANIMGTTKRIAEIYCQNLAKKSKTKFITTRFGNVLGSAGSVIPLFEKQIAEGGPVTVTHRDIKRYFMTISESVSLILQAGSMGDGGEIYVLDMGEPILIRELAEQMIRLSGKKAGEEIAITYTGLRPGEKLFEEIFHESEGLIGTNHPKLQLAKSREISWKWLIAELENLGNAAEKRDIASMIHHLSKIVPEYSGGSNFRNPQEDAEKSHHLKLVQNTA